MTYKKHIIYALIIIMLLMLEGCSFGTESPTSMNAQINATKQSSQYTLPQDISSHQTSADNAKQRQISETDKAQSQQLSNEGLERAFAGDREEGLSLVKQAYALDSTNVANYYNIAMVYKLRGELDDSKVWFEKVLQHDPNNTWSIYGIATIYADQGKDKEALDWLEKAVALDPAVKSVAAEQDHFERFHGNLQFEELVK